MADCAGREGQQLGNYRLLQLLGRGGFADVYLGEHLFLNTQAAIKVMQTRLESEEPENFLREARTIGNLVHPHIIRVLDFGVEGGIPFLVMDYAPNGNLRQRHPKGGQLAPIGIISYVKQVADALQYAHERKLIHRDIKPENMLVGRNKEILLSDFGIAIVVQSTESRDGQDALAGTGAYMAPEQIQGKPRPASDQYALGVVVYEWLCGERPFKGSLAEIAFQHVMAAPPSLREKVATIPTAVEEVLLTALAKDPNQRFASVQEFADAYEQACLSSQPMRTISTASSLTLSSEAITSNSLQEQSPYSTTVFNSASLQEKSAKGGVSRRMVIGGLAGLATLAAGGGIAWMVLSHSSPPNTVHPQSSPTPPSLGTVLRTYYGHSNPVYTVAWSPRDGSRIASAGADQTVQVWSVAAGTTIITYAHSGAANSVAWSPDGKYVASGGEDRIVQVRNSGDDVPIYTYRDHLKTVYSVEWSPDGQYIASTSADKTVRVWNPMTGTTLFTYKGHTDRIWSAAWSPDGKLIASASDDQTVHVWNATTGKTLFIYKAHSFSVKAVAWSPDGRYIASGGEDIKVRVWDALTGQDIYVYKGHTAGIWTLEWSRDGKRIASGGRDATVQIWDAITGDNLFTYRHHKATVFAASWSPDGTRIASGSTDSTVQIWQATVA